MYFYEAPQKSSFSRLFSLSLYGGLSLGLAVAAYTFPYPVADAVKAVAEYDEPTDEELFPTYPEPSDPGLTDEEIWEDYIDDLISEEIFEDDLEGWYDPFGMSGDSAGTDTGSGSESGDPPMDSSGDTSVDDAYNDPSSGDSSSGDSSSGDSSSGAP